MQVEKISSSNVPNYCALTMNKRQNSCPECSSRKQRSWSFLNNTSIQILSDIMDVLPIAVGLLELPLTSIKSFYNIATKTFPIISTLLLV